MLASIQKHFSAHFSAIFEGRECLVTGGLGFIGSNLAMSLVHCGAKVTVMDSLNPRFGGSINNISEVCDQVTVDLSDMRDRNSLDALVAGKEYIFHLAGHVGHADSMREPALDMDVNCIATMNLVEACRKHNSRARIVFTSTRQVYGRPRSLPVNEDHAVHPIDVNGINKLAAEQYLQLYHSVHGIRSTILRLTNTYGPRLRMGDERHGFAAVCIWQALQGETLRLFGGHQRRDFNYVDDVVDAILLAASRNECVGQVFNLGAPVSHSLKEFADVLRKHCDCKVDCVPFPGEKQSIEIGDYRGNFSRFHKATGWRPRVALEEGLARTIEFWRRWSVRHNRVQSITNVEAVSQKRNGATSSKGWRQRDNRLPAVLGTTAIAREG